MNTPHTASLPLPESITRAFSARARPDDRDLVAADVDQRPGRNPESLALAQAFRGLPWQTVNADMVRTFKDALPLFTPAAFAYYLPAYMLACLKAPDEVDTAFDGVIFNLTPPRTRRGWKWVFFQDRSTRFDAAEVSAITRFLALAAEQEQADWAGTGHTPPPERLGRPLDHWMAVDAANRRGESQ